MLRSLFIAFCTAVSLTSVAQTTASFTANDFSSYLPYNGKYSYGVNPGYYGGNWNVRALATIAMGSGQAGVKGAGIKSMRVPIYDDFLSQYGLEAELSDFQYYASLGGSEITAFVGSPAPEHRFDTTFSGSTEPSKVFKNLYEPVWLDAAKTQINPNNYFAKYLYDVVKTYGSYVKFWEIVNEPDFTYSDAGWSGDANPPGQGSWFYHNPNASELVNLRAPVFYYIRELRVAWEVIKQLSPQSYICTGGIGYRSFLDALLRNTDNPVDGSVSSKYPLKAGAYFDVLSFHSYPEYALKKWDNAKGKMVYFRHSDAAIKAYMQVKKNMDSVLNVFGYNGKRYPQKQYICTETGLGRIMSGEDWGSNEGQLNYMIKAHVVAQKNGVKQTYWYQLGDGASENQFDRMGIYQYFGGTMPYDKITLSDQGKALKTTSDLLYGKTYDAQRTKALRLPAGVDGAAFKSKEGSYTYVLWAKTAGDKSEAAAASYEFPAAISASRLSRKEWDYAVTNSSSQVGKSVRLKATPSFFEETLGRKSVTER